MGKRFGPEYDKRRSMRNILAAVGLFILGVSAGAESELDFLLSKASEYSPEYTTPVIGNTGRPVSVVHDFNGDGTNDIAILTVVREEGIPTSVEELRDSRRLYAARAEQPLYILETYFQNDMAVQSAELGRERVLAEVELLRLTADSNLPAAVSVSFRNSDGIDTQLLIHHPSGMVSRFVLHQTLFEHVVIDDINRDGLTDVVIARRVPEAGQGYETFLDLYELAADGYHRRDSVNIVRSLRQFMAEASELLVAGDWAAIAERTYSDQSAAHPSEVVRAVLLPVDLPDSEGMEPIEFDPDRDVISDIVYPRILDNPFPHPYLAQVMSLTLRIDCDAGDSRLYMIRVRLAEDVFRNSPFALLTWDGS